MTDNASRTSYDEAQAEAWRKRDIVEAHRLASREGDDDMKDLLVGAAEVTVQAHVNTCEIEDCQDCKTAAILGIKRSSSC